MVYARDTVDKDGNERILDLTVSGKLWRDALVMRDRETHSLWTQHDGRAVVGPATEQGLQMKALPSQKMTWAEAAAHHPDAKVLKKRRSLLGSGMQDIYADYRARKDDSSVFGTGGGDELPPKEEILGVAIDGQAIAVRFDALPSDGTLELELAGRRLLVGRSGVTDTQGQRVDSRRMYWFAWKRVHPETLLLDKSP